MQLYLTSDDPANSVYCLREGKIAYKVACPHGKLATIWRALPNLAVTPEATLWMEKHFGSNASRTPHSYPDNHNINDEPRASFTSQDEQLTLWAGPPTVEEYQRISSESERNAGLTKIAEIELHTISSTIIRHLGNEWKASVFFRKEGWSWYGSDRVFKGVDGKDYKWKMGSAVSELFLIDGDPINAHGKAQVPLLVARYAAVADQSQAPAMVEIFPAGEDMVDWILITFVYIELVRNGRRMGRSAARLEAGINDVDTSRRLAVA